jgi:hypothetical protein
LYFAGESSFFASLKASMAESLPSDARETPWQASPPLGIRHLLLWMTCSAVLITTLLTLNRLIRANMEAELGPLEGEEQQTLFICLRGILEGPAVASLLIWFVRFRRGLRFPVQPGEWLLVLSGISMLLFLAELSIRTQLPPLGYPNMTLIPMGLLISGYVFVAIRAPLPIWWRAGILVSSALSCVEFGQYLLFSFDNFSIPEVLLDALPYLYLSSCIVPIPILIVCATDDIARQIPRGWLHWTGVETYIAYLILAICHHVFFH